jgi:hypothetical protein
MLALLSKFLKALDQTMVSIVAPDKVASNITLCFDVYQHNSEFC